MVRIFGAISFGVSTPGLAAERASRAQGHPDRVKAVLGTWTTSNRFLLGFSCVDCFEGPYTVAGCLKGLSLTGFRILVFRIEHLLHPVQYSTPLVIRAYLVLCRLVLTKLTKLGNSTPRVP